MSVKNVSTALLMHADRNAGRECWPTRRLVGGREHCGFRGGLVAGLALLWTVLAVPEDVCAAASAPQPTGIIEPFLDVTLSAPVPGIVTKRRYKEGMQVKEGSVLLELDSTLEQLELERRKIVRDQKRSDFEATQKLFSSTKGISKEEVEKKEAEYRVAAVEHDMAAEQMRRRQVLAPNAGAITQIMLEVGEACQPYEPLIRVVDTRRCYLVTNVEAKHGSRLKADQKVTLELDLGDEKTTVPGTIVFLSPVVDPASGLQKVKVLFDNKDGKFRPGLTGTILSET